MGQEYDFSALIGSRICHDLISPIGAINNGLELLQLTVPNAGMEMELISDSVKNASARIRFFRIAFGAASAQQVGRQEITSVLEDMYSGSRVSVDWTPQDGMLRDNVRLAFLALLCLETGMPFGGRIEVTLAGDQLILNGHADKFTIDQPLWDLLEGGPFVEKLLPAQLQFGLLPHLSQKSDRKLSIVKDDNLITITV